ncbi:hypothetical protein AYJ58_13460 [Shewanella sp. Pdp11]|nr:hypothetical protein AYJ58_13460 [Shewanella sp. Pdp11]
MSKYHIGTTEDEFEPGSGGHILRNKLAITDEEDMAEVETQLLLKLYEYVFQSVLLKVSIYRLVCSLSGIENGSVMFITGLVSGVQSIWEKVVSNLRQRLKYLSLSLSLKRNI